MKQRTALEQYMPHAYRFVLTLATGISFMSCLTFTLGHFLGFFSEAPLRNFLILDAGGILYILVCALLSRFGFDLNGELRPGWAGRMKAVLCTLTLIHWNMISYLIPLRAFWGYGPLFLLLTACLLDDKLVLIEGVGLLFFTVLSWYILPDKLGVPAGTNHTENIILRLECLVLTYGVIYVLTYIVNLLMERALSRVSEYDALTGLRNRHSLDTYLKEAATGSRSVAVIGIDDFKAVNTTYGHLFGDTIIRRVAEIITKSIHDTDMVFRLGNDDFLILFGDDNSDALSVCKRVLANIRRESFSPMDGVSRHVTATIGLHGYSRGSSSDTLLEGADANMAMGKRSGKNCIVYSDPDGTVRYDE